MVDDSELKEAWRSLTRQVEALTAERDQWKAEAQALAAGDKAWQRVARKNAEERDALKAALRGLYAATNGMKLHKCQSLDAACSLCAELADARRLLGEVVS